MKQLEKKIDDAETEWLNTLKDLVLLGAAVAVVAVSYHYWNKPAASTNQTQPNVSMQK